MAVLTETGARRFAEAEMPTTHGMFRAIVYRDSQAGIEHIALVYGDVANHDAPLVRVHSECLTGEAFGSLRCDCGQQLDNALRLIVEEGAGCLVYIRGHEGRGIGLANKIAAYALQDDGFDTLDANEKLGLPADGRDYKAAASMLNDLAISSVKLLTNNPEKASALKSAGIRIVSIRSLVCAENPINSSYLLTKKVRFGHLL
ncbi:GTP cyclohydrolase II [Agrobacterium tumefaciens]|uniref:GTP cyclohydrolase II n=1 Tax=Agrobacterium tumefaciens TaxID=358 RepID=UPI001EEDF4C1|nr:GTP cyclohydrolase II [Agrobacterium tumefaciens]